MSDSMPDLFVVDKNGAQLADRYPTLHALGLGPQLEAMERICAHSQAGKHAGKKISDRDADHHFGKADSHMFQSGVFYREVDQDTGERHVILAAARLLMADHCVESEEL